METRFDAEAGGFGVPGAGAGSWIVLADSLVEGAGIDDAGGVALGAGAVAVCGGAGLLAPG